MGRSRCPALALSAMSRTSLEPLHQVGPRGDLRHFGVVHKASFQEALHCRISSRSPLRQDHVGAILVIAPGRNMPGLERPLKPQGAARLPAPSQASYRSGPLCRPTWRNRSGDEAKARLTCPPERKSQPGPRGALGTCSPTSGFLIRSRNLGPHSLQEWPLDPAKEKQCAGPPRGVYSVGLLRAKMKILVSIF